MEYFHFFLAVSEACHLNCFPFFSEKLCVYNSVYRFVFAQHYVFVMIYTVILTGSYHESTMNYIYLTCTVVGLDIKQGT